MKIFMQFQGFSSALWELIHVKMASPGRDEFRSRTSSGRVCAGILENQEAALRVRKGPMWAKTLVGPESIVLTSGIKDWQKSGVGPQLLGNPDGLITRLLLCLILVWCCLWVPIPAYSQSFLPFRLCQGKGRQSPGPL